MMNQQNNYFEILKNYKLLMNCNISNYKNILYLATKNLTCFFRNYCIL